MRVIFTIPGDSKKYSYPTGPEDITFAEFVEYVDKVYSKAPQVMKDIETAINEGDEQRVQELREGITNAILAKEIYPYFARVVSFFTSVPAAVLIGATGPGLNVTQLEALYNTILHALAPPSDQYEYNKTFEFKGQTWVIPDRLMEHSSVIEFAEAAQFQAAMNEVENGHLKALIDVCAVLVRKEGEQYTDNIYKRNKALFAALPMSQVWNIAFFLMNRSEKLSKDFQIYTASRTLGQLKQELKTLQRDTVGT